ncbi:MAG: hypothetical protein ABFE01_05315 [Phycisphaerales bacterium]
MNRKATWAVVVVALASQAAMADPGGGFSSGMSLPQRVLHFPKDQAIGQVSLIEDRYVKPEISREFHPGYVFAPSRYLGEARGDVVIPAGQCACLHLGGEGVTRRQCFDCLSSLKPDDVQDLDFLDPLQVDDAFLPYIARLTGITHFCPVSARFSGTGWATLRTLTKLEHICTPYGLTDDEMAGIATLQSVNEMEIVAPKLTDAGLASIAKLRNMQVLHLNGTAMMTDNGLKALATLPRLRHLRLAGPFTDRGVQILASMPSLKVLWLESPNVTEESLRYLAQSPSLERLCVPWLDRITDRSMTYLSSMPKLKALGVGNAWSPDAGVATLASLTNLEVLALKGGPRLTDQGLLPLPAMPRLRALQIYNSGITEQGIAALSSCKTLDSIEIRSTAVIGDQTLTGLKASLPGLKTLDVCQVEQSQKSAKSRPLAKL